MYASFIGANDDFKLGLSGDKLVVTIHCDLYGIIVGFDVGTYLGSLDGSFDGSNDGKLEDLLNK